MSKASPGQVSFNVGELSPFAAARVDADQYKSALKTCLNLVPTALGPATHRPGTYFAAATKDSTKKSRLWRFEFSTEQAYAVEFGDLYCRFYRNNALVTLDAQYIFGITNANPAVLTYTGGYSYSNGDKVIIAGAGGMTQVNNREFTVANVGVGGAGTFELSGVDSTAYGTFTSGGTVSEIYTVATPYLEADIFQLKFAQSADVLYITHPSYAQRKLSRTEHTSWTLTAIEFSDGPYLDINSTLTAIAPSAPYYTAKANPKNFNLNAVVWSGTQFVAVGAADGTDAYIATSPDGVTWTERANPKNRALYGIAFSGTQYVAVGALDGADAYIITSPDGVTWTERANPKNFELNSVAWNGSVFVAVGQPDGVDAYIVTSPDGVTWTERANPKNVWLFGGVSWSGVLFVAVGALDGADAYIVTSPDGITWTERANPVNTNLRAAAWSGTQFVAVGDTTGANLYIITSPDGITWTQRTTGVPTFAGVGLKGVAWLSNQFLAVGEVNGGDAVMLASPDGVTWTERANPQNVSLNALAWNGTRVLIVGDADGTDAYILAGEDILLQASDAIFAATDVGRLVRIRHTIGAVTTWGAARITAYTSQWAVVASVTHPFSANTASTFWRLGLWSDTTGYPGAVAFYEDRLMFAGGANTPHRIDGSKSGAYENFSPTDTDGAVANDNAVSFTLNSGSVNRIFWLANDEKGLLAGTFGGGWVLRPSVLSEALTPTNVSAKQFTTFGSKNTQALRAGRATLYAQREGRVLREVSYGAGKDGFGAKDSSIVSGHITKTGLVELAYQQYPHEIVWAARADGALLGMLYSLPESEEAAIRGWHRHTLGGAFGSGNAVVESVATIPSADGTYEQLWMIVKRTINGATVRTVEYMKKFFETGVDAVEDAFFVDCGLTYSGAATTVVGGLWHLEGQTVTILADGAAHANKVVTNGQVTLDRSATKVHAGLYKDADGETLRFEAGARDGTAQGKIQRIHYCTFRLDSTVGMKFGPSFDNLDEIVFRSSSDVTDAAIPLFTGDVGGSFDGDHSTEARVCFRQHLPLPFTLLGIYPQITTEDKN